MVVYANVHCQKISALYFPSSQLGEKIALRITPERSLVIMLNGKEVGIGAKDMPSDVYGFIALDGWVNKVKLMVCGVYHPIYKRCASTVIHVGSLL